ncbi:MAG: sensor histidine kinase, partial [Thermomicrobiales bacterium]
NGWPTAEAPPAPADADQIKRALAGDDDVSYVAELDGRETLVTLFPLRSEPNQAEVLGVVQLATTLDLANDVLGRERLLLGLGVLAALVIGALGSLWLTTSALAPLRRMIGTCRGIAAGNLDARVDLPRRQDEVGQLATAVDEMAMRIEAAFTAQRRFIADAAHELRTPLTGLAGTLEVLLRGARDDPATASDLIERMHHEVTRLHRLAEQLLDVSRLDAEAVVQTQPLALPRFVDDILPHAQALGRERAIAVEAGVPVTVHADPDRIQQALLHLVDNAVQHTAPGGVIRLGWQVEPASVDFWVADNGEGIAPGDLPHVFEPFFRGDRGRSRRRGGTGLGLTLVRTIATAHGGQVTVESRPGIGSRFTITLPRTAPPRR